MLYKVNVSTFTADTFIGLQQLLLFSLDTVLCFINLHIVYCNKRPIAG
jgi:hypothetical protein